MRIDYRSFLDKMWESMPADEYLAMASDPHVLGDPLLKTQHFIGASRWEKVSDTEVVGWHQLRVPHQRYADESRTEIVVKGHAHGTNQHWYRKVDGAWKFAGLAPEIRWGEFDFDKVFASGRETFGDQEQEAQEVAVQEMAIMTGVHKDVSSPPTPMEILGTSSIDEEAVHTASGIDSTLEIMPTEVMAKLMQEPLSTMETTSVAGLVQA
jgi:scytalone dehydratase